MNRKRLLIIATLALAVVLAVAAVFAFQRINSRSNTSDINSVNYGPPTEEEQRAGDEQKDKILRAEAAINNQVDQKIKTANVIITDAGQYNQVIEVRAFISNHYEDGTCSITFTQGSLKVTRQTPAYRDASTTICTNPVFERSEFANSGEWLVVVEYNSNNAKGQSEPRSIIIE